MAILHFKIQENSCEIITLASFDEGKGISTALIDVVEVIARNNHCQKLCLSTTNNNLHTLGFYQRRGFCLTALFPGQIKASRGLKLTIPVIGENGIPIRDEIRLEKRLT